MEFILRRLKHKCQSLARLLHARLLPTPETYCFMRSLRMSSYVPFLRNMCTKLSMADRFAWESGSSEGLSFLRTFAVPSPSWARLRPTSAMVGGSSLRSVVWRRVRPAVCRRRGRAASWAANDVGGLGSVATGRVTPNCKGVQHFEACRVVYQEKSRKSTRRAGVGVGGCWLRSATAQVVLVLAVRSFTLSIATKKPRTAVTATLDPIAAAAQHVRLLR